MKSNTDKLKILLVEDDADDRKFFKDALEGLDLNTTLVEVVDGAACINYLSNDKNDKPDLIFLDLNMPVMDGFECLENIRTISEHKKTIVAIYSTSASERDIERTFNNGANIYLNKPIKLSELKKALKQIITTNWSYHTNDFNRENFLLKV